jgi:hypothetical protein
MRWCCARRWRRGLFDLGGKFDRSFNEARSPAPSVQGRDRHRLREFELQNDAQREQALRRFAERGNNPVVDRLRLWRRAGGGGLGVSRHQLRDHRHGGGPAEREIGGVHRA